MLPKIIISFVLIVLSNGQLSKEPKKFIPTVNQRDFTNPTQFALFNNEEVVNKQEIGQGSRIELSKQSPASFPRPTKNPSQNVLTLRSENFGQTPVVSFRQQYSGLAKTVEYYEVPQYRPPQEERQQRQGIVTSQEQNTTMKPQGLNLRIPKTPVQKVVSTFQTGKQPNLYQVKEDEVYENDNIYKMPIFQYVAKPRNVPIRKTPTQKVLEYLQREDQRKSEGKVETMQSQRARRIEATRFPNQNQNYLANIQPQQFPGQDQNTLDDFNKPQLVVQDQSDVKFQPQQANVGIRSKPLKPIETSLNGHYLAPTTKNPKTMENYSVVSTEVNFPKPKGYIYQDEVVSKIRKANKVANDQKEKVMDDTRVSPRRRKVGQKRGNLTKLQPSSGKVFLESQEQVQVQNIKEQVLNYGSNNIDFSKAVEYHSPNFQPQLLRKIEENNQEIKQFEQQTNMEARRQDQRNTRESADYVAYPKFVDKIANTDETFLQFAKTSKGVTGNEQQKEIGTKTETTYHASYPKLEENFKEKEKLGQSQMPSGENQRKPTRLTQKTSDYRPNPKSQNGNNMEEEMWKFVQQLQITGNGDTKNTETESKAAQNGPPRQKVRKLRRKMKNSGKQQAEKVQQNWNVDEEISQKSQSKVSSGNSQNVKQQMKQVKSSSVKTELPEVLTDEQISKYLEDYYKFDKEISASKSPGTYYFDTGDAKYYQEEKPENKKEETKKTPVSWENQKIIDYSFFQPEATLQSKGQENVKLQNSQNYENGESKGWEVQNFENIDHLHNFNYKFPVLKSNIQNLDYSFFKPEITLDAGNFAIGNVKPEEPKSLKTADKPQALMMTSQNNQDKSQNNKIQANFAKGEEKMKNLETQKEQIKSVQSQKSGNKTNTEDLIIKNGEKIAHNFKNEEIVHKVLVGTSPSSYYFGFQKDQKNPEEQEPMKHVEDENKKLPGGSKTEEAIGNYYNPAEHLKFEIFEKQENQKSNVGSSSSAFYYSFQQDQKNQKGQEQVQPVDHQTSMADTSKTEEENVNYYHPAEHLKFEKFEEQSEKGDQKSQVGTSSPAYYFGFQQHQKKQGQEQVKQDDQNYSTADNLKTEEENVNYFNPPEHLKFENLKEQKDNEQGNQNVKVGASQPGYYFGFQQDQKNQKDQEQVKHVEQQDYSLPDTSKIEEENLNYYDPSKHLKFETFEQQKFDGEGNQKFKGLVESVPLDYSDYKNGQGHQVGKEHLGNHETSPTKELASGFGEWKHFKSFENENLKLSAPGKTVGEGKKISPQSVSFKTYEERKNQFGNLKKEEIAGFVDEGLGDANSFRYFNLKNEETFPRQEHLKFDVSSNYKVFDATDSHKFENYGNQKSKLLGNQNLKSPVPSKTSQQIVDFTYFNPPESFKFENDGTPKSSRPRNIKTRGQNMKKIQNQISLTNADSSKHNFDFAIEEQFPGTNNLKFLENYKSPVSSKANGESFDYNFYNSAEPLKFENHENKKTVKTQNFQNGPKISSGDTKSKLPVEKSVDFHNYRPSEPFKFEHFENNHNGFKPIQPQNLDFGEFYGPNEHRTPAKQNFDVQTGNKENLKSVNHDYNFYNPVDSSKLNNQETQPFKPIPSKNVKTGEKLEQKFRKVSTLDNKAPITFGFDAENAKYYVGETPGKKEVKSQNNKFSATLDNQQYKFVDSSSSKDHGDNFGNVNGGNGKFNLENRTPLSYHFDETDSKYYGEGNGGGHVGNLEHSFNGWEESNAGYGFSGTQESFGQVPYKFENVNDYALKNNQNLKKRGKHH